jgi:uracil-DNA glycosylase
MVAAVRCAPPANKPTVAERDTCAPWLTAEYARMAGSVRVVVCLGAFAWQATWPVLRSAGFALPRPRPAFGHGVEVRLAAAGDVRGGDDGHDSRDTLDSRDGHQVLLIGCYHPSQQNTFTGRVTPAMLDAVFRRARSEAGLG